MSTAKRKPAAASKRRSPKPNREPDTSRELMAIVDELVHTIALIRTAIHGLQHCYTMTDEIVVLETAVKALRRIDSSINNVAEGRPSEIRPEEIEDEEFADEESAE